MPRRAAGWATSTPKPTPRLSFRKDVLSFLHTVVQEDLVFVAAVDRMLRFLWRTNQVDGEDIAYLLGRISGQQDIDVAELRDENVLVRFWPFIGDQLREEVANAVPVSDVELDESIDLDAADVAPSMTPDERLAEWERLDARMADWWPHVPAWEQETRDMFQLWERKDPEFVALWKKTRDWSMADLYRIFDEFGATFFHIFWESEVEDPGRAIVRELLDRGIAEISDGLPVVKIDEKLGLETETYRTMPILRSDGTTLYSTKDLALTKQKFEEYEIDRAVWVVDVRQSLYFDQVSKILELYGFEQAADTACISATSSSPCRAGRFHRARATPRCSRMSAMRCWRGRAPSSTRRIRDSPRRPGNGSPGRSRSARSST